MTTALSDIGTKIHSSIQPLFSAQAGFFGWLVRFFLPPLGKWREKRRKKWRRKIARQVTDLQGGQEHH